MADPTHAAYHNNDFLEFPGVGVAIQWTHVLTPASTDLNFNNSGLECLRVFKIKKFKKFCFQETLKFKRFLDLEIS